MCLHWAEKFQTRERKVISNFGQNKLALSGDDEKYQRYSAIFTFL